MVGVVVIALWAVMAVFLFVVAWKNDALAPMHWCVVVSRGKGLGRGVAYASLLGFIIEC